MSEYYIYTKNNSFLYRLMYILHNLKNCVCIYYTVSTNFPCFRAVCP
nr:MAG TPA: hypothetical protein [Bacteriophage sp.]